MKSGQFCGCGRPLFSTALAQGGPAVSSDLLQNLPRQSVLKTRVGRSAPKCSSWLKRLIQALSQAVKVKRLREASMEERWSDTLS